jgi:hypothetical protein
MACKHGCHVPCISHDWAFLLWTWKYCFCSCQGLYFHVCGSNAASRLMHDTGAISSMQRSQYAAAAVPCSSIACEQVGVWRVGECHVPSIQQQRVEESWCGACEGVS